ncbi:hypothetical protein K443DRAFT_682936 [Laccaria amethystina LaAM-08-1]|uniref:Uncharacterized protein n=1 Tax=Laccaria amethystina LaAM-08-1 TaxID=1095629 RepID=A0A0C9WU11_9AGAR|nr:hypothetical protein K443DRAFT_682936 [Laccaria amethystina LaAM-08-1]
MHQNQRQQFYPPGLTSGFMYQYQRQQSYKPVFSTPVQAPKVLSTETIDGTSGLTHGTSA